jgi:hypothetical protein
MSTAALSFEGWVDQLDTERGEYHNQHLRAAYEDYLKQWYMS